VFFTRPKFIKPKLQEPARSAMAEPWTANPEYMAAWFRHVADEIMQADVDSEDHKFYEAILRQSWDRFRVTWLAERASSPGSNSN